MSAARPRLVLVGPPGAGKTSVGKLAAARLGVRLRETDDDVEAMTGQPLEDVLVDHGEQRVRALETVAVRSALDEHDGVLSVGSGAVESAEVRALLSDRCVVFLDVGSVDAARRSGLDMVRPVQLGNVRARLKQLLEARRPLYLEVAHATVSTDGRSIEEVTDDVIAVAEEGERAHAG
jgi:shikimate kinase